MLPMLHTGPFLVILFILIAGSATAFLLLFGHPWKDGYRHYYETDEPPFHNFGYALKQTFAMMFGAFDPEVISGFEIQSIHGAHALISLFTQIFDHHT